MTASMKCPVYTAILKKSDGTKYRLKGITTDMVTGQGKDDLAEKATITIVNVKAGKKMLHNIIKLRDKITVYANTGNGAKEVFSGFVWERQFDTTSDVREIKLVCYDKLIYLQNSKDNLFVSKGSRTKDVVTQLAKKWGIKIKYSYDSISNKKIVYRSEYISDILISLLNRVKKQTGNDYVVRFEKNVMVIEPVGSNKTVYKVESRDNAISASYNETMEGMITKVKIIKAETTKTKKDGEKETGKYTTVSNVKGDTKTYGTLQDIIEKGSDDKMADVKKEANQILKKDGSPKREVTVEAVDNPWIKKGHKVFIKAGALNNNYIVKSIEHDATNHVMTLEVKRYSSGSSNPKSNSESSSGNTPDDAERILW